MKTPTLSDVARHAGVSYATADRVVNLRGRVAEKSARKVQDAVTALGYVRNVAAANLSRQRTYRFVFVLPSGDNAFFARIRAVLADRQARLALDQTRIEVETVAAFDDAALSARLDGLAQEAPDGLAVVGLDSPALAQSLGGLRVAGVPVVSLVSDLPVETRSAYVGIDNLAAGRTAARLTGLAHGGGPGVVLPVVGALSARDHSDRLAGFRAVLERDFPKLTLLPEIEGRDRAEEVAARVSETLAANPGITAIYNAGAGNSGLRRVLAEAGPRPFCIVHELVPHSRAALEQGLFDVVIDQQPEAEVDTALALLRAISDQRPLPPRPALSPTIFVRDNLPPPDAPSPQEKDRP